MKQFIVIGHRARTDGDFSLNDMPGGAGRMDVLCRCVNSSFFLSHDLRRDAECYLVLLGEPDPPKTILFRGDTLRYLSPDERSAGSLIKKALALPCDEEFRESTPGVFVRRGGLEQILSECNPAILDEGGTDIRDIEELPSAYLLSDHQNFSESESAMTEHLQQVSVGPAVLHADHTITVVLNEMDRRGKTSE
ncbi:tRNA (pseudouridine(54)-N(1))-methyltransferase TrmY [Methanogenium organophilum]|uniref:tRNA (pseudouridine(54)-N(1))-methyltransferase n=1 Tax=Methanogenium organophilum TaxID=2199 RepID=A0A9X9S3B3_METOG|nr:tRNA (pseudouridine(54)-N(1))-methyltransferase TrmY [Methanogenium organophilum]WAI00712.1 tRNA (pseudouridine(54)-N(1))-methyltransferase TrmY [Methanogenium organophilum]